MNIVRGLQGLFLCIGQTGVEAKDDTFYLTASVSTDGDLTYTDDIEGAAVNYGLNNKLLQIVYTGFQDVEFGYRGKLVQRTDGGRTVNISRLRLVVN